MIKNKIQVLIVEDSRLYQAYLRKTIESDDCLSVAGVADCGSRALELISELKPDIVTLDLLLPDMDGFELLREITELWDVPVIVVSGNPAACERAIQLGARDFIEKIQDAEPQTAEQFRLLLKLKLKMQAEARPSAPPRSAVAMSAQAQGMRKQEPAAPLSRQNTPVFASGESVNAHIIAIGASLGGTEATLQILRRLPATLPGIVVVQHMPPEYTSAYAMRLDRCCGIEVREAKSGDLVLPGAALIAQGGAQLTVYRSEQGFRVKVGGSEKYGGFCPSVDVLFHSLAAAAGSAALGVILTGMGRDGAAGLKEMHDAGAYTLGQNRETCAVFGMPGAAEGLGALDKLLSPDMIADEIKNYCSKLEKVRLTGI